MAIIWLLKLTVFWISIDVVIMATGWYLVTTIQPLCPNWWRRVVIDEAPELVTLS